MKEDVWFGIDAEERDPPDEDHEMLIRALRMHPGATISIDSMLLRDVSCKRTMEMGSPEAKVACQARLEKVLRTVCELGIGRSVLNTSNVCEVHKYLRCS